MVELRCIWSGKLRLVQRLNITFIMGNAHSLVTSPEFGEGDRLSANKEAWLGDSRKMAGSKQPDLQSPESLKARNCESPKGAPRRFARVRGGFRQMRAEAIETKQVRTLTAPTLGSLRGLRTSFHAIATWVYESEC